MADKKTKQSKNQYADKSVKDLEKAYLKIDGEYQQSLSKGKLTSQETAQLRRERAQILQSITAAKMTENNAK